MTANHSEGGTPRTDDAEDRCSNCGIRFVPVDFAEGLERELSAARYALAEKERELQALLAQPKAASARVADGVAAIPSADEVTAKAQSDAAPDSGEGMPDIIKFLLGEGSLEGVWWGEPNTERNATFWWRSILRAYALSLREKREGMVPRWMLDAKWWEEQRSACHATYNGGHEGDKCDAFHHGMDTVFNVIVNGWLAAAPPAGEGREKK
jgi:hypothetical protein